MTADVRPGPNAQLPCGSWSRRVTHLAHGETCVRCGTDREIPNRYPDDHPNDKEPACTPM